MSREIFYNGMPYIATIWRRGLGLPSKTRTEKGSGEKLRAQLLVRCDRTVQVLAVQGTGRGA